MGAWQQEVKTNKTQPLISRILQASKTDKNIVYTQERQYSLVVKGTGSQTDFPGPKLGFTTYQLFEQVI